MNLWKRYQQLSRKTKKYIAVGLSVGIALSGLAIPVPEMRSSAMKVEPPAPEPESSSVSMNVSSSMAEPESPAPEPERGDPVEKRGIIGMDANGNVVKESRVIGGNSQYSSSSNADSQQTETATEAPEKKIVGALEDVNPEKSSEVQEGMQQVIPELTRYTDDMENPNLQLYSYTSDDHGSAPEESACVEVSQYPVELGYPVDMNYNGKLVELLPNLMELSYEDLDGKEQDTQEEASEEGGSQDTEEKTSEEGGSQDTEEKTSEEDRSQDTEEKTPEEGGSQDTEEKPSEEDRSQDTKEKTPEEGGSQDTGKKAPEEDETQDREEKATGNHEVGQETAESGEEDSSEMETGSTDQSGSTEKEYYEPDQLKVTETERKGHTGEVSDAPSLKEEMDQVMDRTEKLRLKGFLDNIYYKILPVVPVLKEQYLKLRKTFEEPKDSGLMEDTEQKKAESGSSEASDNKIKATGGGEAEAPDRKTETTQSSTEATEKKAATTENDKAVEADSRGGEKQGSTEATEKKAATTEEGKPKSSEGNTGTTQSSSLEEIGKQAATTEESNAATPADDENESLENAAVSVDENEKDEAASGGRTAAGETRLTVKKKAAADETQDEKASGEDDAQTVCEILVRGLMRSESDVYVGDIELIPSGENGFDRIRLASEEEYADSVVLREDAASDELKLYVTDGEEELCTVFSYAKDTVEPEMEVAGKAYKTLQSKQGDIYCTNSRDIRFSIQDGEQSAGLDHATLIYGDRFGFVIDDLDDPRYTLPEQYYGRVNYSCQDQAGNISEAKAQYFLIEKDAPSIRIVESERYTAPYTMGVSVEDVGDIVSGIDTIECTVNGVVYEPKNITSTESVKLAQDLEMPSKQAFSLDFSEVGHYDISIRVSDNCGNAMILHKEIDVTDRELVAVFLAKEFKIYIDPDQIFGRDQIFSEGLALKNISNVDTKITVKEVNVNVASETLENGVEKDCQLYMIAPDTGERIPLQNGMNEDVYSFVIPKEEAGTLCSLDFAGELSDGSEACWKENDIAISLRFAFEECEECEE